MNPNPLSAITFLILPSGIWSLQLLTLIFNWARLYIAGQQRQSSIHAYPPPVTLTLAWQIDVVIDFLHVIAIVEHIDELFEQGQVLRTNGLACLRKEGDLLDFQLNFRKRLQQCRFSFEKLAWSREYR